MYSAYLASLGDNPRNLSARAFHDTGGLRIPPRTCGLPGGHLGRAPHRLVPQVLTKFVGVVWEGDAEFQLPYSKPGARSPSRTSYLVYHFLTAVHRRDRNNVG